MPALSPADRDRGLRLVGTVTGAVAAVSLVAAGATTALAAGDTEHPDGARPAAVGPLTPAAGPTSTVGTAGAAATKGLGRPVTRPLSPSATTTPKPRTTTTRRSTPRPPATSPPAKTYATPPPVPSTGS